MERPGFKRQGTDFPEHSAEEKGFVAITTSAEYANDVKKDGAHVSEDNVESSSLPNYSAENDGFGVITQAVETAEDLVTQIIHVEDDVTQNPITFRTFFLGVGLSIFGAVLQEIFYFKPQTIFVSVVFLTVIAYILGEAMAVVIPRRGFLKYLNPGPFNQKEHAAITIMASAAAQSATSTQALAAQQLFYGGYPNKAAGIFITLSTQLIGFGIAGLLRDVLVYPTKLLWPVNLPVATLLEVLHRDKNETKRRLRFFYIVFICIFVWETLPEYMFTVLTGVSIFCLAKQDSLVFTNLFGGASGNEGLGFLSICFDWNYIAGLWSPLWLPLETSVNVFIGICGCYILFMGVFYGNIWNSQNFPFMSQLLFDGSSNSTNYVVWNQTAYLNDKFELETDLITKENAPWITGTYLAYMLTSNMGLTATFTHMLLWNMDDIKAGWAWASPANLRRMFGRASWKFWQNIETPEERLERKYNDPKLDPHYKLMLRNKYKESPVWWWAAVVLCSFIVGMVCLYVMKSTLPWWGLIVACLLTTLFMLFFGTQMGMTGFQFNVQPICQMLGGYMFPGRPLANFYFVCYTYNALQQGQILAKDIKLAQYAHLPPRFTFLVQIIGCIVGALFNWIMMATIVENQAPLLTAIQGSNIWSGQNIQFLNTQGIAWSIADKLFNVGARYQWVSLAFLIGFFVPLPLYFLYKFWRPYRVFTYINLSIILWYMGNLFVGINSSFTSFFIIAALSQFYFRKYKPELFVKYNYLLSAAMDGGTQVMVFIFSFAVFGASGKAVPFPTWAGTPDTSIHNNDYCMVNPANNG